MQTPLQYWYPALQATVQACERQVAEPFVTLAQSVLRQQFPAGRQTPPQALNPAEQETARQLPPLHTPVPKVIWQSLSVQQPELGMQAPPQGLYPVSQAIGATQALLVQVKVPCPPDRVHCALEQHCEFGIQPPPQA